MNQYGISPEGEKWLKDLEISLRLRAMRNPTPQEDGDISFNDEDVKVLTPQDVRSRGGRNQTRTPSDSHPERKSRSTTPYGRGKGISPLHRKEDLGPWARGRSVPHDTRRNRSSSVEFFERINNKDMRTEQDIHKPGDVREFKPPKKRKMRWINCYRLFSPTCFKLRSTEFKPPKKRKMRWINCYRLFYPTCFKLRSTEI